MPAQQRHWKLSSPCSWKPGIDWSCAGKVRETCNNPPELARCRYCMARVKIAVSLYKVDSPPNCSKRKSNKFNQFDLTRWRQLGSITYSKRFRLSARVTSHSNVVFTVFLSLSMFLCSLWSTGWRFPPSSHVISRSRHIFFFFNQKMNQIKVGKWETLGNDNHLRWSSSP